jgi:leucine dehydrogenase
MSDSLFDLMRDRAFTSLSVEHDRETSTFRWFAAREWSDDVPWEQYGESADMLSTGEWLTDEAVNGAIDGAGLRGHADRVMELMRQGRHEKLELLYSRKQDIRYLAAIHATIQGPPAGGMRRHPVTEREIAVIADILNLARGMSFKDAAAGIPNGGCKLGVHTSTPPEDRDDAFYGFLAYCIDRSDAFTGPDMGFSPRDADRIRRYTHNIVGGTSSSGSGGATGVAAGWGVFLAIQETLRTTGAGDVSGVHVAVQGVGELGGSLVGHLAEAGARITVADLDEDGLEARLRPIERATGAKVTRVPADQILGIPCDVLAPCAVGGILDRDTIPTSSCRMIVGGANNQLAAHSQDEELSLAEALAARDVLFVPDWIANAGGVIQGKMEHVAGRDFRLKEALDATTQVVPTNVRAVLETAARESVTPLLAAYRRFEPVVYG